MKTIREQEVVFMKQNGDHEVTTDQQSQLNALLDKNEQTISGTPASN